MADCEILSLNVRGVGNRLKRLKTINWLQSSSANIIFIQETHSQPGNEKMWENEWKGKILFSHGAGNAWGVTILLKKQ